MSFPMTLTRSLASLPFLKAAWDKHSARATKAPAPMPASLRRRCVVDHTMVGGFPVITLTPHEGATGIELFYLHGGSYENPLIAPHWSMIAGLIRRTGATVTLPLYGLAPEHTVAEAYPFLDAVYERVVDRAGSARVYLAGDSAGGGLAAGVAIHQRDAGIRPADALLLICPWFDVTLTDPAIDALEPLDPMLHRAQSVMQGIRWAGDIPVTDPRVSPVFDSLAGLPPIFVYQGTHDILLADAKTFTAKARRAGTDVALRLYPGAIHVFPGASWTPESRRSLDDMALRMLV